MLAIKSVVKRTGMNPKELKRFLKFAVVGVIGAVVDFGSFNLMFAPMTAALDGNVSTATTIASSISFILAILSNFIWNRYWTYPESRSKSIRRQFVQFFLVNLTGILPRAIIVRLSTTPFTQLVENFVPFDLDAIRLGANLAVALSVGIVMFWNFFANRYWTYNDVDKYDKTAAYRD